MVVDNYKPSIQELEVQEFEVGLGYNKFQVTLC